MAASGRTILSLNIANQTMDPSTKQRRKYKKTCRESSNNDDGAQSAFATLCPELLILIIMKLGFIDYLSFGGVCKEWRKLAIEERSSFVKYQPPLTFLVPLHAKKACYLHDTFDGRRYKTMLTESKDRSFVGLSCGYLVRGLGMNPKRDICLVNLITRHELHFPDPINHMYFHPSRVLCTLIYSSVLEDYLLFTIHLDLCCILLSQRNGNDSSQIEISGSVTQFVDMTFFNGNIYVLTADAKIGKLRLRPSVRLELLDVYISIQQSVHWPFQLVASDKHLFMVSCFEDSSRGMLIHKLDEEIMKWKRVVDLGEDSVFLSGTATGSSAVINPTKWGGHSNCIYIFESTMSNGWSAYSLKTGQKVESCSEHPVVDHRGIPMLSLFWYFPQQCFSRNEVHDSFGM